MKKMHKSLLLPWTNKVDYTQIVQQIAPANLIAYWPMAEASGSVALDASGNGRNGAYTAVTLGAAGIGDGRTAASFNGTTSFNNIYSAGLAGAFNGQEGTAALWVKVVASTWTDGQSRRAVSIQVDANNLFYIRKDATNNQITANYIAGGTAKNVVSLAAGGITAWVHLAMTWSKSANAGSGELKVYLNGAQIGATQTGLGVWAGTPSSTLTLLGTNNAASPSVFWLGLEAHAAIWSTPLSAAQIATLVVVP